MSAENTSWALTVETGRPHLKLMLLLLADGAGVDGYLDPDLPRLAAYAEMSVADVEIAIVDLLRLGALEVCDDGEFPFRLAVPLKPREPNLVYGVSPSRWAALRRQVFARDGQACTYCGSIEMPLHCDHVVPFSKGGPTELENLTTACKVCNIGKRARTPQEWRS